MRLCAFVKSSQLTLFALVLFLIVMNLKEASCNREIKALFHDNSQGFLTMYCNGTVSAAPASKEFSTQCLEIDTVLHPSKSTQNTTMTIYNRAAERYLCFNKGGKLVTRKRKTMLCEFQDSIYRGSLRLESVKFIKGKRHYIAFNKDGKSIKNLKNMAFAQFMKVDDFDNIKCSTTTISNHHHETNETIEPKIRHRHNKCPRHGKMRRPNNV